jgi:two-component system, NarL family, nitrate/nitrite response regulator NarL
MNCQLLAGALERFDNVNVVGSATSAGQTLKQISNQKTRVALINSDLQDGPSSGFRVVRDLRTSQPNVRSILLLDSSEQQTIIEAFRVGAKGVFCRAEALSGLHKCIRRVDDGQIWANSGQLEYVLEAFARIAPAPLVDAKGNNLLSKREQDVCQLVSEGLSNREIARNLELSVHTVKNYLFHSFEKLGISSRVELILYMYSKVAQRHVRRMPLAASKNEIA